jgi:hypothetical protein
MDRKNVDLKRVETQTSRIEALRAELKGCESDRPAFAQPFVAHGGKPPAPPARD